MDSYTLIDFELSLKTMCVKNIFSIINRYVRVFTIPTLRSWLLDTQPELSVQNHTNTLNCLTTRKIKLPSNSFGRFSTMVFWTVTCTICFFRGLYFMFHSTPTTTSFKQYGLLRTQVSSTSSTLSTKLVELLVWWQNWVSVVINVVCIIIQDIFAYMDSHFVF